MTPAFWVKLHMTLALCVRLRVLVVLRVLVAVDVQCTISPAALSTLGQSLLTLICTLTSAVKVQLLWTGQMKALGYKMLINRAGMVSNWTGVAGSSYFYTWPSASPVFVGPTRVRWEISPLQVVTDISQYFLKCVCLKRNSLYHSSMLVYVL